MPAEPNTSEFDAQEFNDAGGGDQMPTPAPITGTFTAAWAGAGSIGRIGVRGQDRKAVEPVSKVAGDLAASSIVVAGNTLATSDGLCVVLKLAHTLQAGTNTFQLGASAYPIVRHTTLGNLATAYSVGSRFYACFDGANSKWQDMSQ